ncbi:AlpA family transcriptional regulator [Maridesulfovibrio ferrireducens]|uniref:helix-turn-helix transcriptional regulator n=1 Tax=Maridesulfovibrio ferrireducens TaxID=246191 RepID=UPI001A2BEB41|nr:hypothetical protein [Maridesulfovibrio ferrireducens]MBI9112898.1 hypothetical protein [Maridesulfovibrio ferrireducens]
MARQKLKDYSHQTVFENLLETLPLLVPRKDLTKYLGSLISVGHMANLDSAGLGPASIKIGGRIVYTRESLVKWLEARSQ